MPKHEDDVKAIIAEELDLPMDEMKPDTNFKDGLAIDDFKKSQMITALRESYLKAQDVIDYVGIKLWWYAI
ncbi:hypothetical protein N7509_003415 [Penicillium cosmopolitanum]|uniref:Uncharacterized protein n=1 Tax=Penicillium cosmopolitanum TaxID=1131564 RepID=A0A9X0BBG9_9EURO|nr:uncharacterized protein N7509_003415 [Penicillium cosmopolitanum]KAJ5403544.1 hypothetical protein N7509_003415 [Penicillium cosmopolitanum]